MYVVKFKNIHNVVYIGSTHLDLKERLQKHKYHTCTLFQYINKNKINWDDVYIELYEIFKYNKRQEYENRETEIINTFLKDDNYIVINCAKTGGSPTKQIIKDVKYYLIENLKDIIEQNIRDYNLINLISYDDEIKTKLRLEKARQASKDHHYKNKEKRLEQMKEYRDNPINKEKNKRTFICDCGATCLLKNKTTHFKSLQHIRFMNS